MDEDSESIWYQNGDFYKGQVVNNKPNGFGEKIYHDEGWYEGSFKDGKRDGIGRMFFKN